MLADADYRPSSHVRWRWVLAALAPGTLSILLFAGYMVGWLLLRGHERGDATVTFGTGVLYTAAFMPLSFAPYLYLLGRRYVRVVHHGHKPVMPFVLGYGVLNLLLWGAAATALGINMGGR